MKADKKKTKRKQLKLTTKIMIMYLLLSAVLMMVLLPMEITIMGYALDQSLSTEMENSLTSLEKALYIEDGRVVADESKIPNRFFAAGVYIRAKDTQGEIIYQSLDADWVFYLIEPNADDEWKRLTRTVYVDGREVLLEAFGSIYFNEMVNRFAWIVYVIVPVYLTAAGIGAYFLARSALKPVNNITQTAIQIKDGDLTKRIEGVSSKDEVGELADTFNAMLDELEASFKREKQFSSDASHELRTPVSVIAACVDEAQSTDDPEIIRDNLQMIRDENQRMTGIISQLLMLSRGYEGRYHFEPEDVRLRDIVDSVSEVAVFEAEKKRIVIVNNVDPRLMIRADQSLYTQALMNVIGNAVKYGREDGHIWLRSAEEKDMNWLIVEDDGIGIAPEDLEHIFERFYRADTARDRNGSGLGLSIVKWIVDLHEGTIKVSSKLGEGTRFDIGIPKTAE